MLAKMYHDNFLLVFSLVNVDKKSHLGVGGSKKSIKSVMYYLNGPLGLSTRWQLCTSNTNDFVYS
jgi:hypothetical protein